MMRHWIRFEGRPYGLDRDKPRVSLNRNKAFLLNLHAFRVLGKPAAVEFLFDPNNQTIGIVATDPKKPHAFPVNVKRDELRVVYAAAFCAHFGIAIEHTVAFKDPPIAKDGIMTLDLKKPSAPPAAPDNFPYRISLLQA